MIINHIHLKIVIHLKKYNDSYREMFYISSYIDKQGTNFEIGKDDTTAFTVDSVNIPIKRG